MTKATTKTFGHGPQAKAMFGTDTGAMTATATKTAHGDQHQATLTITDNFG